MFVRSILNFLYFKFSLSRKSTTLSSDINPGCSIPYSYIKTTSNVKLPNLQKTV
jgi:hypothetical protein